MKKNANQTSYWVSFVSSHLIENDNRFFGRSFSVDMRLIYSSFNWVRVVIHPLCSTFSRLNRHIALVPSGVGLPSRNCSMMKFNLRVIDNVVLYRRRALNVPFNYQLNFPHFFHRPSTTHWIQKGKLRKYAKWQCSANISFGHLLSFVGRFADFSRICKQFTSPAQCYAIHFLSNVQSTQHTPMKA